MGAALPVEGLAAERATGIGPSAAAARNRASTAKYLVRKEWSMPRGDGETVVGVQN
jgi:hypothetical protein